MADIRQKRGNPSVHLESQFEPAMRDSSRMVGKPGVIHLSAKQLTGLCPDRMEGTCKGKQQWGWRQAQPQLCEGQTALDFQFCLTRPWK
jgi:hypothetical protein